MTTLLGRLRAIAVNHATELSKLRERFNHEVESRDEKIERLTAEIAAHEEVHADKRRLVREIDVLLNGAGAAQQASLCDLVHEIGGLRSEIKRLTKELETAQMDAAVAGTETGAFWKGHDEAVAGVAGRWRAALEDPIPKSGAMNEPLESLYRRTEALRTKIERRDAEIERLSNVIISADRLLSRWAGTMPDTHKYARRAQEELRAALERKP
jgi:predicted nuclease with TOPRIM domain